MKKLKLRELSNPIHKAVEGQAGVWTRVCLFAIRLSIYTISEV